MREKCIQTLRTLCITSVIPCKLQPAQMVQSSRSRRNEAHQDYSATPERKVVTISDLISPSISPSSVGTPTRIDRSKSGSSWLDFKAANMSAVACRLRDHTIRRRGKWSTNNDNFEITFVGAMSSPTSVADWMIHNQQRIRHLPRESP
jgi:hypothetical protein